MQELLSSEWAQDISCIYCVDHCSLNIPNDIKTVVVSKAELERISHFKTANEVLAVVGMRKQSNINLSSEMMTIALDKIKDPGNLGTIIRTSEWFGNQQIICSEESVDCYNPKVIQASMGAFFRVNCFYVKLDQVLDEMRSNGFAIYGAEMSGADVYKTKVQKKSVLLMGSESHGISSDLKPYYESVNIPKFGETESLNVAMATGIILSEFKRKLIID